MQNIQESGECVTSDLANLGLVHQRLIKEIGSVRLLAVLGSRGVLTIFIFLLLGRNTRYVEAHLNQLVPGSCRLLASESCSSKMSICASIAVGGERKVDSNFILSS